MTKRNPYIEPYDHFSGYNKSIEQFINHPEIVEFDKLCYELFATSETGKKFLSELDKRYLLRPLADPRDPNYSTSCIWAEGFKSALRTLKDSVESHRQRIKQAESKPND